jgi:hypothetical protein
MKNLLFIFFLLSLVSCMPKNSFVQTLTQNDLWLFNGTNLNDWEQTDYAGKGKVIIDENGSLVLEMGAELSGVIGKVNLCPS